MAVPETDDPYGAFAAPAAEPRQPSDRHQAPGTANPLRQSVLVATMQLSAAGVGWMLGPTVRGRYRGSGEWWTFAALVAMLLIVGDLSIVGRFRRQPEIDPQDRVYLLMGVLACVLSVVATEPFMGIGKSTEGAVFGLMMLFHRCWCWDHVAVRKCGRRSPVPG